jgi:hypothetical protein
MIGADIDQAMEFQLALGPAGEIVREAGALAVERRPQLDRALRTELGKHVAANGEVVMQSASWCITARKPS